VEGRTWQEIEESSLRKTEIHGKAWQLSDAHEVETLKEEELSTISQI
jgi:hypothetical protein